MGNKLKSSQPGFTIVELLIVIVIIAILAAITIVAYNGIQSRATVSSLKSSLKNVASQMELAKVDSPSSSYPTSIPSAIKAQSGVMLSLSENGTSYCVNAETTTGNTVRWSYDPVSGYQEGLCSGAVIANSEVGANPNLIEDQNFQSPGTAGDLWGVVVGSGTNIAGTSRAGTGTDPYPSRPVLRITNAAAQPSATFSYLKGPVTEAAITSGTAYTATYYVRLASGTHASSLTYFAVMNGSAANASIPYMAGAGVPNSSWQKITRTVTATQNGIAGTFLYLGVGLNDVKATPFVLEFQGFELRAN